jgi:flagellin-like hook-associated protein FlgL
MTTLRPFAAGMFSPMRNTDRLIALKHALDDAQRQLSTGKRADTYGTLGAGRTTSLSIRASMAETTTFAATSKRAETRAGLMAVSLDQITKIGSDARRDALSELSAGTAMPTAAVQTAARARLDAVISALNADFDGQYLFSGTTAGVKPVLSTTEILGGTLGADGLNQLISERRAADLGNGLGRTSLTQAGTTVTLAEEAAGLPFGLKLATVANGLSNTTSTLSGTPPAVAVSFSGQPQPGDKLDLLFTLPDGTSERLTLTARATGGAAAAGSFLIGADAAATSASFAAALDASVRTLVESKLAAASAIVASEDFFTATSTAPARRIDGPPFDTATGFAASGSRPTALWYQGDADPAVDPRETQTIQVDRGLHLAVGARATENPFRKILAGLAALAAGPLPGEATYRAMTERSAGMVTAMGGPEGREIVAEVSVAREQMVSATARHQQTDAVLQTALSENEDISIEELSVRIVSLQTRLEASYQVTASIGQLRLADYLR